MSTEPLTDEERIAYWRGAYERMAARNHELSERAEHAEDAAIRLNGRLNDAIGALKTANIELSALVPNPNDATLDEWPCQNPADRECLDNAFVAIRNGITKAQP